MRSLKILFLCLCVISFFGFAEGEERRDDKFTVVETAVQNSFPNVLRPVKRWFKRFVGIKQKNDICQLPASIVDITLNPREITAKCLANNTSCSDYSRIIEVIIHAVVVKEEVTFVYKVSGGEIVGKGSKVNWNLSGVKTGIYTITVGIDEGAGVVGKTVTKEVKVIECPDCS